MALYQPTNITPSLSGALGNGIVDIESGLSVSWQVNGSSPMTAFSITIYENNAESTQVYTTGKIADGCPFYNTTTPSNISKVKTVFFTHNIAASALAAAKMVNGREYKMIIKEWWSDSDSVTQSSASVFKTRAAAVLKIADVPSEISTKSYTFSAVYTQAQGDMLSYIEWQLLTPGGNVLYDTGKLYSTSDMSFTYDGFFTGEKYTVRCFGQTANNEEIESDDVTFAVSYETMSTQSAIAASCVQSGVKVSWSGLVNIAGAASGDYSVDSGILKLPGGSSVTWSEVNNEPMKFRVPWSIVWRGEMPDISNSTSELVKTNSIGICYAQPDRRITVSCTNSGEMPTVIDGFGQSGYEKEWQYSNVRKGIIHFFNYANGLWVALGIGVGEQRSQGIYYSTDAVNWIKSAAEANGTTDIQYGSGLWVACPSSGAIYSEDCITWHKSNVTKSFNRARYANGIWVGTGSQQGTGLWYSADGKTWTRSTSASVSSQSIAPFTSVVFSGGLWVTGGAGIYYSTDGMNWTTSNAPSAWNRNWYICGCSNGMWHASDNNNGIYYSTDGKSWNATNITSGLFYQTKLRNGIWVAYGLSGIYYSEDGKVWTASSLTGVRVSDIDYHNGVWLAACGDENSLYKSLDGKTWSKYVTIPNADFEDVSFLNGVWLAGGETGICSQKADDSQAINPGDIATVIVTPTHAYYYIEKKVDYLAPNAELYPSAALYPRAPQVKVLKGTHEISYKQTAIDNISLAGPQKCIYLQLLRGEPENYEKWLSGSYVPVFDENTYMLADFKDGLQAGNISENITAIGYSIYRREAGESAIRHIGDVPHGDNVLYDYGVRNQGGEYTYYMFTIGTDKYATAPLASNTVSPLTWEWTLLECEEQENGIYTLKAKFSFGKNLISGSIGNNNSPNVLSNFTRYPKIQKSPQNYRSGTLESLIGAVGFNSYGRYVYADSIALRNAIYELSTTEDTLFLKDRKGDLIKVRISGPIAMTTADNTREQMQTASIPWTETGDASDVSIIANSEVMGIDAGVDEVIGSCGSSGSGGSSASKWLPVTGGTLTGEVIFEKGADMAENRITSVAAPEGSDDAANKQYVDSEIKSGIKEAAPRVINNVSVTADEFHADSTYEEFPYAAEINISGVMESDIPEVIFGAEEAASGNFAPVCSSVLGGVVIYAACAPADSITIPTIIIKKPV